MVGAFAGTVLVVAQPEINRTTVTTDKDEIRNFIKGNSRTVILHPRFATRETQGSSGKRRITEIRETISILSLRRSLRHPEPQKPRATPTSRLIPDLTSPIPSPASRISHPPNPASRLPHLAPSHSVHPASMDFDAMRMKCSAAGVAPPFSHAAPMTNGAGSGVSRISLSRLPIVQVKESVASATP